MNFEFSAHPLEKISSDIAIVFAFQAEKDKKVTFTPLSGFQVVDAVLDKQLTTAAKIEKFSAKRGEMLSVIPNTPVAFTKVVVIGLGKVSEFIGDDLRRVMGSLAQKKRSKVDSFSIALPTSDEVSLDARTMAQLVTEGVLLGSYEFSKYKASDETKHTLSLVIFSEKDEKTQKNMREGVSRGQLYSEATILARDLVNEQPAVATPTYLAKLAQDIAKSDPQISCTVYNKEQAEKMGMEAFLGIARASDTPPQFIHLEWTPQVASKAKKEKLAIIGKGITFDSGGINVKPGDHMSDMKMDMSGAALVLGVFSVIAKIKPDFPVMGIIAATPNMVSGSSIVPGDVVRAMNGKTIEVLNTDAEGRVTMADSLSYAIKHGATQLLDFATLTGACMVALGTDITGLFSNNHDLAEKIKAAAFDAGEKVWELPLEKEYKALNKSDVADIANIPSSRYGGALTAALFLEEFVANKPWAHFDIAGPAFTHKPQDISGKGGTGHGVRTVLNLLVEK